MSRCQNKIQNKLISAVYPVGALPAPLVRLLQHPDDGDAVLLPGVGQGRHPLGVLQSPARSLVYQHPHKRNVAEPYKHFLKILCSTLALRITFFKGQSFVGLFVGN